MGVKKINFFIFIFFLFAALVFSQNLAEAAKKEKKRRAALKGKKSVLITNADLKQADLRPAVSISGIGSAGVKSSVRSQTPHNVPIRREPSVRGRKDSRDSREPSSFKERLENPEETVGMLTEKMNYLRQKFYSFRDWTLRDEIQREMVRTYEKLRKAREAEKKPDGKKRIAKNIEKN